MLSQLLEEYLSPQTKEFRLYKLKNECWLFWVQYKAKPKGEDPLGLCPHLLKINSLYHSPQWICCYHLQQAASRSVLSDQVATSYMLLFMFHLNGIKIFRSLVTLAVCYMLNSHLWLVATKVVETESSTVQCDTRCVE
jgi:hypothetical protein